MSGIQKAASGALGKVTGAVSGGTVSLKELLSNGGWRVVYDGKLAEALLIMSPTGELVGEDVHGNKYFERNENQAGRNRWVVYNDKDNQTGEDPSTVTSEWHGWLHFVSDQAPTRQPFSRAIYAKDMAGNPTGTDGRYLPKGSWYNPKRRNWVKMTAWEPPNKTA